MTLQHRILSLFSLFALAALLAILPVTPALTAPPPVTPRAKALMQTARIRIEKELPKKGLQLGAPIFIRIFKIPGDLEVWLARDGRFQLFKNYPICSYSGYPGPKLMEGDWQSPEGFYTVSARQMNPNSSYHLAFNVGYPNDFDRARNRTGSAIMVHGGCSSRGCFAMGNSQMEEIYLLAHAALAAGQQEFALHIFPFRLTARNLFKFRSSPWIDFWKKLQPGYDFFEQFHKTPLVSVVQGNYLIQDPLSRHAMTTKEIQSDAPGTSMTGLSHNLNMALVSNNKQGQQ